MRGRVDDQVVVLRLHEEDRIGLARYRAAAGARLALEHVDVVQRDDTEDVDALFVLALQLRGSTRPLALGRRIRDWGRLILETRVRNHLAEEACRFDRLLRVHEHSLAAKHMLIQRERGGLQHAQKVGEVQRWVGIHMVLSCRIANESVGNSPERSKRGTHLVPIATIVNIKKNRVPHSTYATRQRYPDLQDVPYAARRTATRAPRRPSCYHPGQRDRSGARARRL